MELILQDYDGIKRGGQAFTDILNVENGDNGEQIDFIHLPDGFSIYFGTGNRIIINCPHNNYQMEKLMKTITFTTKKDATKPMEERYQKEKVK